MSDAKERIDALVQANDVLLFMKGTPLFPQCGFSSRAIAIPQLYVKGEFVGGSDIMMEMFESGELKALVGEKAD